MSQHVQDLRVVQPPARGGEQGEAGLDPFSAQRSLRRGQDLRELALQILADDQLRRRLRLRLFREGFRR